MKYTLWIFAIGLAAVGVVIGQGLGYQSSDPAKGQPKGPVKAAPRDPAQSPASTARPPTATSQSYSAEQIQAGELRFTPQCGFCHGRDAAGGETGPDLTRSELVAGDTRGDKIGPLLRQGRPEQGMPSFNLEDAEVGAIAAFIHDQKTKFDAESGGRRSVDAADLATGNVEAGRSYFNGAGGCARCHSATGDLAGIASRYQGLTLIERMLYPSGRPAPAPPKVTFTLPSGQRVIAPLAGEDEFTITVFDPLGARQTYKRDAVKFEVENPMSAHFDQLGKYTDKDMHNVFAYLDSLK